MLHVRHARTLVEFFDVVCHGRFVLRKTISFPVKVNSFCVSAEELLQEVVKSYL